MSLKLSVHTPHKYQPYFSWLQWEQTLLGLCLLYCPFLPMWICSSCVQPCFAWGLTNLRRLSGLALFQTLKFCIFQPLGDNLRLWLSVSDTDGNLQDNIQGRELNIITYLVFRDERGGMAWKTDTVVLSDPSGIGSTGRASVWSCQLPFICRRAGDRVAVPFSCKVANPTCEAAVVTATVTWPALNEGGGGPAPFRDIGTC